MTIPKYAVPSGAINGANTLFTVGEAYTPGSVAVFLNGLLVRRDDDDGWTESNPSGGEITLTEAPRTCDTVNVFYIDTTPPGPEIVIENLFGTIKPIDDITGVLETEGELSGLIAEEALLGVLEEEGALNGIIQEETALVGVLEEDCE